MKIIIITLTALLAFIIGNDIVQSLKAQEGVAWRFGDSKVERFIDTQTHVVCYIIPQAYCVGHCAYSPAISCVKQ